MLISPPVLVLAEVTTVAYAVVAVGLLAAAYFLSQIKKPEAIRDDRPTTISLRGEWASYLIGRGRPSVTFLYAGHRFSTQEGKGGKGLGGKSPKTTIWWEEGAHLLGVGPLTALFSIEESAKTIFKGPITPLDTPSGSTLTCTDGSIFRIYWGERLQPVDPLFSKPDRLGYKSRYPYKAYIYWVKKRLGSSANWPNLEYDVEGLCVGSKLLKSSCVLPAQSADSDDYGPNGAHMIYQIATGTSPWGAGALPEDMDFGTLQAVGQLAEFEHLPQHYNIKDGVTCAAVLADILVDLGVVLVQQGEELLFLPVRPPEDGEVIPVLDDRIIVAPNPEHEIVQGNPGTDRIVFICKDHQQRFKDVDFPVADDGTSRLLGRQSIKRVGMNSIKDRATGAKVADRRTLELLATQERVTLKVSRTFRRILPGQAFVHPQRGKLRAAAVTMSSNSNEATIDAIQDQFSLALSGYTAPGDPNTGTDPVAEPDLLVKILELPHEYVGETLALGVARIRGSSKSGGASVWASLNGTSYASVGSQASWAAGGHLYEDLLSGRDTVIERGPLVVSFNSDIENVLDLSGDEEAWRSGRQVCIIEEEAFYLRNLQAEVGGYRLMGLIRARLGTLKQDHLGYNNPPVIIFQSSDLVPQQSSEWAKGSMVWIKCVPDNVSIEDIIPQTIKVQGLAFSPLPVDNLSPLEFEVGDDIDFEWTFRVRNGSAEGAGEVSAGTPLLSDAMPEGPFLLRLLQAGTLYEITRLTVTVPSWTYTSVQRATDFGGVEPLDFVLEITPLKGSQGAYPRSWTISQGM